MEIVADGAVPRLAEDVGILIFEAVREVLFNVVKHAGVSEARVEVVTEGGMARVTVSDRGRGFEASPAPAEGGGTGGFGLASIRERLGLVGGSLEVGSAPGAGSRVVLLAPATPPPRSAPRAAAPVAGPALARRGGRIRVVVADDHPVMLDGLARMLAEEPDIEVVGQARDGQTAIALACELAPDVVLLDVSMPGLSGIEATRAIVDLLPAVRVVGLSMLDDAEVARAMLEAGASAHLSKSDSTAEILRAVRASAAEPVSNPADN